MTSSIEQRARDAAWRDRIENGRDERPRDRWAITALGKRLLAEDEQRAAYRMAGLIERANGQGRQFSEFIDGRFSDPHARAFDRMYASRLVTSAMMAVQRAVDQDGFDLFIAVFAIPHQPVEAFQRDRIHDRLAKRLRPVLLALRDHFDASDAEIARHKEGA